MLQKTEINDLRPLALLPTIFKKPAFFFIFLIKILLLFSFSSEYHSELFFPFINSLSFTNLNPWQTHYEMGLIDSFPYHGLMLILLFPFTWLGDIFGLGLPFLKIPLLIADIVILIVLLKLFPSKEKKVLIFYFLNPIIIYSTFIHSQLDIIPTSILLVSIYFLTLEKIKISAIAFGLALSTKIHVLVALPLILFYIFKKLNIVQAAKYLLITFSILLMFDWPFMLSEGFINMVIFNPKQSLLFDTFYNIGSLKVLLPISAILLVYMHFFNQNKVNHDLMFFYFGLLFTATLFFIYPGPAWYIWMIPFVCIYFIQNENQNKSFILHLAFSSAYLAFFIFFYESEYIDLIFLNTPIDLKINNENLRNTAFTFIEITLLAIVYAFYKYGIKSNSIYKKKTNLSIGIGGDSGSGKTKLLNNLDSILKNRMLKIEGDGEHKWERGNENWSKYTHLDPKANFIHQQAEAIYQLKQNRSIFRSEYDHTLGKFTQPNLVQPKEFIIIAGLHPFYLPKLRKNIDLKIYIDTDEVLRKYWKVKRDSLKRGHGKNTILQQIENRMIDGKKYIHPQKDFSDMIIKFFPINSFDVDNFDAKINIGLKLTFDANIHIENILDQLQIDSLIWDYNDDLKSQYIELRDEPRVDFNIIAINAIDNLNEIISPIAKWSNGYDGLIQLLCIMMISERLREE
jgi:uridine kinase